MTNIIIISLVVGFGVPILLAVLAYKLSGEKTIKPITIDRNEPGDLDLQKLRFMKEIEFWRDYNEED